MINFRYEHISAIMDLADNQIRKLEADKNISFPAKAITIDPEMDSIMNASSNKVEEEIRLLREIKDGFSQELKKINFSFGMGDRGQKESIQNIDNGQPKHNDNRQ